MSPDTFKSGPPADGSAGSQEIDSISDQKRTYQALDQELSRVKQKYRAAQYDLERERKAHAATRSQLASVQQALHRYEESAPWALYVSLLGVGKRFGGIARNLSGASRKQRRRAIQAIAGSGLFDPEWYLKDNPDVAAAGVDPLLHFYDFGWREGRDPGPLFATSAYLKSNPDVARSGVNPLVHYVEHGQSEGRAVRAPAVSSGPVVQHNFPQAAPVYRGDIRPERPTAWRRSYRLSPAEPNAFLAGGRTIGFVRDPAVRQSLEAAFASLAVLSGFTDVGSGKASAGDCSAELVDAWYVNKIQLRTRWRDRSGPVVVRAFQHDPTDGRLTLVAEALAQSELDPVDLSLVDPWFPILIVFARPDGLLSGAQLLAFPSLCRGGLHYPELLAVSSGEPDPMAVGLDYAARLQSARREPTRLVQSIAVDVQGADGTSPMFDRHFRTWLEKVGAVSVVAAQGAAGPASELLGERFAEKPTRAGALLLPGDMVPSIFVLTLTEGTGEASELPSFLAFVIAGVEPSQPATLIDLQPTYMPALATRANGYAAAWPLFLPEGAVALPPFSAPAAIRLPSGRAIADPELLMPAPAAALEFTADSSSAVTWLLFPNDWKAEELAQSVKALAMQSGAKEHRLLFVGSADHSLRPLGTELFGDRAIFLPGGEDIAAKLTTPFVSYVGPGVILHDDRSAIYLTSILADSAIASAACALVSVERHGRSWQVSVTDAGRVAGPDGLPALESGRVAELLWRTAFPVLEPPRDLWMARSSSAKKWLGSRPPQRLRTGAHVCTTLITASYLGPRSSESSEVRVPPAASNMAMEARALFG